MRTLYRLVLLCAICFVSCHDDINDDDLTSETTVDVTTPYVFDEIEGDLIGYVYDGQNEGVASALVSIYSATTMTDEFGAFRFDDVGLDGQGTRVTVDKPGYLKGEHLVFPNDNGSATARVALVSVENNDSYQNEIGAILSVTTTGTIAIKPNDIVKDNGSTAPGAVYVDKAYNKVNEASILDATIGGFMGEDALNRDRILSGFGFFRIGVSDESGNPLKLKAGANMTLTIPFADHQALATITGLKLWRQDEQNLKWVESSNLLWGEAGFSIQLAQMGKYLIAKDSPLVRICGLLVNQVELVQSGFKYRFLRDGGLCGSGISDEDGYICAMLPRGEQVILEIYHPICNDLISSHSINIPEEPSYVGSIEVELTENIRQGQLFCDDVPVADGLIIVKSNNQSLLLSSKEDGRFEIDIDKLLCAESSAFTLIATAEGQNKVLELTAALNGDLVIDLCKSDCDHTVGFSFAKADYCNSGEYDSVTAVVTGGSGNYTYDWDDGGQGLSSSSIASGITKCLSVVDINTGCESQHCEIVQSFETVSISSIAAENLDCQQNSNTISIDVVGGVTPIVYDWSGPNGYSSSDQNLENIIAGEYTVVIRDQEGCVLTRTIEAYDVTVQLESSIENLCDQTIIAISEGVGYGPFLYRWNTGSQASSIIISDPGFYSVTVEDTNGCERSRSFDISIVGQTIEVDPEVLCDGYLVSLDNINLEYQYTIIPSEIGLPALDFLSGVSSLSAEVFETGFRFDVQATDEMTGCSDITAVNLPYFEGLSIADVVHTSCQGCTDGQVIFEVDTSQPCEGGCEVGEIRVIQVADKLDVTDSNTVGTLVAGAYYVVTVEASTGCYIAYERVSID